MDEEELNEVSETFARNIWGEGLGDPSEIADNFLESLIGFKQRLQEQRNRYPLFPQDVQIDYLNPTEIDTKDWNQNIPAGWNVLPEREEVLPPGVNQGKRRGITKPAVCPRKRKKK